MARKKRVEDIVDREERNEKRNRKADIKIHRKQIECIGCGATVREADFTYDNDYCDQCIHDGVDIG